MILAVAGLGSGLALGAEGDGLVFSTFIGDFPWGANSAVAVGSDESIYSGGSTTLPGFPVTAGAFDITHNGDGDGFVFRLSPDGTSMLSATFLGGSGRDLVAGVALTGDGRVVVVGGTASPDFPTTVGAYDTTHNGSFDVFIAVLSADLGTLLYSSFLGGSGSDFADAVGVTSSGDIYVSGATSSSVDFPVTEDAYDTTYNGGIDDVFVARLSPAGSGSADLVFATYLGGSGVSGLFEVARTLTVDNADGVVVGGATPSADFPIVGGFDTTFSRGEGFVSRLDPTGATLSFSTFVGGFGLIDIVRDIVVTPSGELIIAGDIGGSGLPVSAGAFDTTYNGGLDGFIIKLTPAADALVFGTYVGSPGDDLLRAFDVNGDGSIVAGGFSASQSFPTTAGAYDTSFNGGSYDGFVVRLSETGDRLLYGTFLGGSGGSFFEGVVSLHMTPTGIAVLAGATHSVDFPTTAGAFNATHNGRNLDGFVAGLNVIDTDGPVWLDGAQLTASEINMTSLTLTWDTALDDFAVAEYRIYQASVLVATVQGTLNNRVITGLDPGVGYVFQVEACDAALNCTLGPTTAATTQTPIEAIQQLIGDVEALGLQQGIESSLVVKLNAALVALDRDNTTAAINLLQAFATEVEAQAGIGIPAADAAQLINEANQILAVLQT